MLRTKRKERCLGPIDMLILMCLEARLDADDTLVLVFLNEFLYMSVTELCFVV